MNLITNGKYRGPISRRALAARTKPFCGGRLPNRVAGCVLTVLIAALLPGCIKGPLWRSGYISPWARQRWAEEERIAASIYTKRGDLQAIVASANAGAASDQSQAAAQLTAIAQKDPSMLIRAEAVRLLGELNCPQALSGLQNAAADPQSEIRMAAVQACENSKNPEVIGILQQVIGGDSDVDIRLAATRALQAHRGPQAVQALALALEDGNPALQIRAADALQKVTGENFGHDVVAWRDYARRTATPPNDKLSSGYPMPMTANQPSSAPTVTR